LAKQDSEPAPVPEEPIRWGPSTTINDAIEAWKANGWGDLSPKTMRGYEEIWQRYVRASFGRRRISSLNPYEVERFFRSLKSKGAGRSTVRRVKALLHRSCRLAAKWSGGSLTNPVSNAELPVWSLNERRPEVRAPGADEVCALITAVESADLRFGAFLHLLAATGVRRGEACALRWSNVDWEDGVLRVVAAVVAAPGGAVVKSPKTRASIRAVALDPATMAVLSRLQDNNRSLAEDCGVDLADDGFVLLS
jgi:integrase